MSEEILTPEIVGDENTALDSLEQLTSYLQDKKVLERWALDEGIKPTIAIRMLTMPDALSDNECRRIIIDYTAIDISQNDFMSLDMTDEVLASVKNIDIMEMIRDFRDTFLIDYVPNPDDMSDVKPEVVVLNYLIMAISAIFAEKNAMAMACVMQLMNAWYPKAYSLAIVLQEVPMERPDVEQTTMKLVGIGSLKDIEDN